jgi:hypothetical protein
MEAIHNKDANILNDKKTQQSLSSAKRNTEVRPNMNKGNKANNNKEATVGKRRKDDVFDDAKDKITEQVLSSEVRSNKNKVNNEEANHLNDATVVKDKKTQQPLSSAKRNTEVSRPNKNMGNNEEANHKKDDNILKDRKTQQPLSSAKRNTEVRPNMNKEANHNNDANVVKDKKTQQPLSSAKRNIEHRNSNLSPSKQKQKSKIDVKPNNTDKEKLSGIDTVKFIQQEYENVSVTYQLDTDSSDIDSSTGAPHVRWVRGVKKVPKINLIYNNDKYIIRKNPKNSNQQFQNYKKDWSEENIPEIHDNKQDGNYKKDMEQDDGNYKKYIEQDGNYKNDITEGNEITEVTKIDRYYNEIPLEDKLVLQQLRNLKYQKGPIDKEQATRNVEYLFSHQKGGDPSTNWTQQRKSYEINKILKELLNPKDQNDVLRETPEVPRIVTINNKNNYGSEVQELIDKTLTEHKDYQTSSIQENDNDKYAGNDKDDTNNSKSNDALKTPSAKKRISNREIYGILDVTLNTSSESKARQLRYKYDDNKSNKRKSKF